MDVVFLDGDLAEIEADIVPGGLVMIAGDVDDLRAVTRLSQKLLDDVVMFLWPVEPLLQLPAVADIADKVERVASRVVQEMQQVVQTIKKLLPRQKQLAG